MGSWPMGRLLDSQLCHEYLLGFVTGDDLDLVAARSAR